MGALTEGPLLESLNSAAAVRRSNTRTRSRTSPSARFKPSVESFKMLLKQRYKLPVKLHWKLVSQLNFMEIFST